MARSLVASLLGMTAVLAIAAQAVAQDAPKPEPSTPSSPEIDRMVADGMIEALAARLAGDDSPNALHLLALAHANKAAQMPRGDDRNEEFAAADKRFEAWIDAVDRSTRGQPAPQAAVAVASAVAERAGVLLSKWCSPELDQFEITNGMRKDGGRLFDLLSKTRDVYRKALDGVSPLAARLTAGDSDAEEQYLALGIYDTIRRLDLDLRFNLAWVNLYLAMVGGPSSPRHTEELQAAERTFRELDSAAPKGDAAARCRLGLAMALRGEGRFDEARKTFEQVQKSAESEALKAQCRYEQARNEIAGGRFDEARQVLNPLAELDPERLTAEQQPARFYINLAALWDANSYLVQADELRKTADASGAPDAIRHRARRVREIGLARMNKLIARGDSWRDLVELYVAASVNLDADPKTLTAAELLFVAQRLTEDDRAPAAIERLTAADARTDVTPQLAGEIAFELGSCYARVNQRAKAADAFDGLVRTQPEHPLAPQAARRAAELRAAIAGATHAKSDYEAMAAALVRLLQLYPEHEFRDQALCLLPMAQQAAGDYAAAANSFARVPKSSPLYDDAQYRRVLCEKAAWDAATRESGQPPDAAKAARLAADVIAYARAEAKRLQSAGPVAERRSNAQQAMLVAAEIQVGAGKTLAPAALETLDEFDRLFPESDLRTRRHELCIRALVELGRFAEAGRLVGEYLSGAPPEEAGPLLQVVGQGLSAEIDRLAAAGDGTAARELAGNAAEIFEQLNQWIGDDPDRERFRRDAWYGLARMRYLSGDAAGAVELVDRLLAEEPRNGNFQRLQALVLTAAVGADAKPEAIVKAREAWGALLRDPQLRDRAPERYWEARYNFLKLLLAEGRGGEVAKAIRQERIWYPELGGAEWKAKFEGLLAQAVSGSASGP